MFHYFPIMTKSMRFLRIVGAVSLLGWAAAGCSAGKCPLGTCPVKDLKYGPSTYDNEGTRAAVVKITDTNYPSLFPKASGKR